MSSLTVSEAIATRRAVRNYTDQPILDDVLDQLVAESLQAPSAFNAQARELVVVTDQAIKDKLVAASGQPHFGTCAACLITVGHIQVLPDDAEKILAPETISLVERFNGAKNPQQLREAALRDAMLLAGFVLLSATGLGLATGPATGWDEDKVKAAIGLEGRDDRVIGLVITAGYSDHIPPHPGREDNRRINNHY